MKLSYYTIDDLRLGYDPQGEQGWRQSQFLDFRDALEQYRSLPDDAGKAFGVSDGDQSLDLVITKYRVDGVTPAGAFVPLDLSHWEFKQLERRTQERLDHK